MRLFKNFALVFLFIGTLASCDGMDATYKEFIEEGPIVYIGKVDSLKAYAGRNRAMLEWQKLLDPRAKTAKIFWENRTINNTIACKIIYLNLRLGCFQNHRFIPSINARISNFGTKESRFKRSCKSNGQHIVF